MLIQCPVHKKWHSTLSTQPVKWLTNISQTTWQQKIIIKWRCCSPGTDSRLFLFNISHSLVEVNINVADAISRCHRTQLEWSYLSVSSAKHKAVWITCPFKWNLSSHTYILSDWLQNKERKMFLQSGRILSWKAVLLRELRDQNGETAQLLNLNSQYKSVAKWANEILGCFRRQKVNGKGGFALCVALLRPGPVYSLQFWCSCV